MSKLQPYRYTYCGVHHLTTIIQTIMENKLLCTYIYNLDKLQALGYKL